MIIDFHTHVFSPRIKGDRQKYVQLDPLFSLLYSNPKAIIATADDLIASMDDQSIDKSVILNIAWDSGELCHETNQYILESVARYPGRLIGFGMIKLDEPETALREVASLAEAGGRGIGEIRPLPNWLRNPNLIEPVVNAIIERRLILLTHTSEPLGHLYDGKGDITPQSIYPFLQAFPKLKMVCAHWGGGLPFYSLMPEVRKSLAQVYFDSAASPYLYRPEVYRLAADLAGTDKILFGSDYPLLPPSRLLKQIQSLRLGSEFESRLLCQNALNLLGIPGGK